MSRNPASPGQQTVLRDRLVAGISQLGLALDEGQLQTLLGYLALLTKWNRVYNLTAVRDPAEMVARHLLDSLSVSPYVHGERLLDVGTGPGLPGMVLAVARPELHCVLLDSSRKKTRFCLQAAAELGLANVEVVRARIEEHAPARPYNTLVLRAFRRSKDWLELFRRFSAPDARVLMMMGTDAQLETEDVARRRECAKVMPLSVPGLRVQRHLLVLDMGCMGFGTGD